jgi:heme exporter protein D
MVWAGWDSFWAMGGYGSFVWGAYGVTVLALAVEVWLVRTRRRRALAEVERNRRRGGEGR